MHDLVVLAEMRRFVYAVSTYLVGIRPGGYGQLVGKMEQETDTLVWFHLIEQFSYFHV